MAVDFATLALRVENSTANRNLDETGAKIEGVVRKTDALIATQTRSTRSWTESSLATSRYAKELLTVEQAMERQTAAMRSQLSMSERLSSSFDKMRNAARQSQANAMASMIQAADPFQKVEKAAAAAPRAALNFGRLRESLTGVAMAAAGTSGPLGSFASTLGVMTAGAPLMVGVLAAIAALAFAWSKLTEKSRLAKEEFQRQLDVLRSLKREQDLGITGEAGAAVKAGRARLEALGAGINRTQRLIDGGGLQGQSLGFALKQRDAMVREYTELALLVQAGEVKVTQIKSDEADEQVRKAKERTDKELAEIKRLRDAEMAYLDLLAGRNTVPLGGLATGSLSRGLRSEASGRIAAGVPIGADVFDSLRRLADRTTQKMEDAAKEQQAAAKALQEAGARQIAGASALSLLSTFGGRGGQVGAGVITATMEGAAAGGPWGAAIAGSTALVTGLFGMSRAARDAREQLDRTRDAIKQSLSGMDALEAEYLARVQQIHDAYDDEIRSLRSRWESYNTANAVEAERNGLIDETTERYKEQVEAMKRLAALEVDDLKARQLRAMGLSAEADAMDFTTQQQREYQQAVLAGKDATYLAELAITQKMEAEARAAELERQRKERLEDLNLRMMEALGVNEDQIDAARRQIANERELAQAQRDGADAATLARIAQVQQAEAVAAAIGKAKGVVDGLTATIGGLQTFRNQLLLSDVAGQSPAAKLAEAERQYTEIVTKARAGNADAAGNLPGAANTFLSALRTMFASGPEFQTGLQRVLSDTDAVMKVFEDQRTVAQKQLDELIALRKIQQDAFNLQQSVAGFTRDNPRRRRDEILEPDVAASVAVLQAGFTLLATKIDTLVERVDENTTTTRNGFEGSSL